MKRILTWAERKKNEFMGMSIARKIRILLLTVSLVPLCCVLVMFYRLSAFTMKVQTSELIQANLEQSASNVQNFWQSYENIIQSIYIDDFYEENLEPINRWDSREYYSAKAEITKRLENIAYTNREILGIAIMGKNYDTCFYDSITESSQNSVCFDINRIGKDRYMKTALEEGKMVYSPLKRIGDEKYGSRDVLYIACQLRNFENYAAKPMGCIMLCLDEGALKDVYGKSNTNSNITMILNRYGEIVSFPQESLAGVNILEKTQGDAYVKDRTATQEELEKGALLFLQENEYLNGRHLEVVSKAVAEGRCYVINVQNIDYAMGNFRYIVAIMIAFGVLAGLLCMILALVFSEQVDRSVKPILRAMDKADKGDLRARIKYHGNDEFADISRQFNRMIEQISASNEQEKEAVIRKKNAEIKSLEAQINPHFLYNTLDAINWVAIDRQEYTISRMLTSLAAILRYSINGSNGIVELRSELEYLRKYVWLQQQRFDYSFLCTIDVDEKVLSCKVHKLLIQPLLENTLVHGFPGKTGMDEVKIGIHLVENGKMMQISVEDNGVGMPQENVEIFNHFDYQNERIESSIGVRNVITRLKMYYGDEGSFFVESGENGTRITMRIPYER